MLTWLSSRPSCLPLGSRPTTPLHLLLHHLLLHFFFLFPFLFPHTLCHGDLSRPPPAPTSPAPPRHKCSSLRLCWTVLDIFPGTEGGRTLFSSVVRTTNVGSVSSGQPLLPTVAQTRSQSIASHWKQKNIALMYVINFTGSQLRIILNSI